MIRVNKDTKLVSLSDTIVDDYKNITIATLYNKEIDKKYYDKPIPDLYKTYWHYKIKSTLSKWFKAWVLLTKYGELSTDELDEKIGKVHYDTLAKQGVFNYDEKAGLVSANPVSMWKEKEQF